MRVTTCKQERKSSCGAAALRMAFLARGKDLSEREIIRKLGGLRSYGTKLVIMAKVARELDFKTECFSYDKKEAGKDVVWKEPRRADLKTQLAKRRVVIVPVRAALFYNEPAQKMKGHFIVVTKYDKGIIYYNDPHDGKQYKTNEDHFLLAWYHVAVGSSAYLLLIYK